MTDSLSGSGASRVEVHETGPDDAPALVSFFERTGVACYCRYWHFDGSSNAWLDRIAHAPEANRDELKGDLAERSDRASGLVAQNGADVVGWLKLAPVIAVPKMYERRPYRRLPCFGGARDRVLAIGCILVDTPFRRTGVPDALVEGAVRAARARGAVAVEALPRRAEGLRDEERWMGSFSTFRRAGFEIVHDFGPYPVLRLTL